MRKSIILSLLLVFAISLSAQEQKQVEFAEITHDFGVVQEGDGDNGKITNVFKFKNLGSVPIYVESARASCGCTVPTFDKTPILPGETGEIPVTYNTNGRAGSINKSITVTFKDGGDNTFIETLYIKGNVIGKAQQQ